MVLCYWAILNCGCSACNFVNLHASARPLHCVLMQLTNKSSGDPLSVMKFDICDIYAPTYLNVKIIHKYHYDTSFQEKIVSEVQIN